MSDQGIKIKITTFQIIIYAFALTILMGSALLSLPISTKDGAGASFFDALFTSTSAVCVTGLVIRDTWNYWSLFGRTVILLLIQIGGLGIVTVALLIFMLSGKKISLTQRLVMKDAISADRVGGITKLTSFILRLTLFFEISGALILYPVFSKEYGTVNGLGHAVFHSVSAFCNAGFDLMGSHGDYSSLCPYKDSMIINLVIIALIVCGGLGFMTWKEISVNKWKFHRYSLQSRSVLFMTLLLIFVPAVCFYLFEFASLPMRERLLASLFQSVTTRTAGFNTQDLNGLNDNGKMVMIILMLIGGAPGSTAGGMKITTIIVLVASAFSAFRDSDITTLFRRTVKNEIIKKAAALFFMYSVLFISAAMIISHREKLPILTCLFETASAIGTVGLSLGITPALSFLSRSILIFLMFFGRVGGLTIVFAAITYRPELGEYPSEDISVG
ncbi:MAG: Trk family potassium uptake protein [Lachnospiraceae bacterium]|nr:Trk family potassium uptake protein [Lachnospiraceae bacterium]